MKTKVLTILVFLILTLTGLIFNNSESSITVSSSPVLASIQTQENNRWLDKFYVGAVHDGFDCLSNYQNLNTLGFNIWHLYSLGNDTTNGRRYPLMKWYCGNILNDSLFTPVSVYKDAVNTQVDIIHSQIPDVRIVTMRPKIEYLCYGQRSDYQCEEISTSDDLWFYSFNNLGDGDDINDSSQYGNGERVRYYKVDHNQTDGGAQWVVKRLKANTEQCKRITSGGNQWQGDSYCDWIIKPRIRIPSSFPITNPKTPVCSIKVVAQDGDSVLKEVVITGEYFGNTYNPYDGSYKEEFYFPPDTNLTIPKTDWGNLFSYKARGTRADDIGLENKADIKIYWYGNCDMWIDYVRVDTDVADKLFKDYYDDPNNPDFMWIKDEVNEIGKYTAGGADYVYMKYYLELVEFNNLPCMAYVNQKLKQYSDNKIDLIQDLKTNSISQHVPWNRRTTIENASFLDSHYIKKVGFTQVFAESYPMTGCYSGGQTFSKIPNTLPCCSTSCNDSILAEPVSPEVYDTWLQNNLNHPHYVLEGYEEDVPCSETPLVLYQDRGNFRYKMQLCDTLSKLSDIPFIFMPQAHQWYRPAEVRREPTNEELEMMANVSVSYGARGIIFFCYNSYINTLRYFF